MESCYSDSFVANLNNFGHERKNIRGYKSKETTRSGRILHPDLASQFRIPKLFEADYVLFYAILIFTADFCLARGLSLLGWIASFIVAAILYFISLNLAFPVLERREWK